MKKAPQSLGMSSQRSAADGDGSQKEGGAPRREDILDQAAERRLGPINFLYMCSVYKFFLVPLFDHTPTLTSLLSAELGHVVIGGHIWQSCDEDYGSGSKSNISR